MAHPKMKVEVVEKAEVNEMVSDLKAKKPKKAAFVVEKELVSSLSPEAKHGSEGTKKKAKVKAAVKSESKSEAKPEVKPVKERKPATPAQAAHRKAFGEWKKSKTKLSFAEFKSSHKKEEEVKEPSSKKKYRLKQ